LIVNFEIFLSEYVHSDKLKTLGIPSVKHCAEAMNLSANYFSDLLKSETGKNVLDHIHYFVLEQAKNILLNSGKRINEIAYDLGFEYPQNFSKLFKKKIGLSPTDFRTDKVLKHNNIN
jgi:AraC-like DNA-binding protein